MKITFLGVGEACDPLHGNTSLLVAPEEQGGEQVLLDCGFTVPHVYFGGNTDPQQPAALFVSHFHGDHFLGIPLLLLRFWEAGRRKPLTITGRPGIQKKIYQLMELAYPGFLARLQFDLDFIALEAGRDYELAGFTGRVAEGEHSQPNLAIRLDRGGRSMFYSGDGRPSAATSELAKGCRLVVHEAYGVVDETPGHASMESALAFARQAGAAELALVHIGRGNRPVVAGRLDGLRTDNPGLAVSMPAAGAVVTI